MSKEHAAKVMQEIFSKGTYEGDLLGIGSSRSNQKGGMMTPEAQRIAIAEACGTMRWSYALPKKCVAASVPKYTEDLNAMHEAEKVLTSSQMAPYVDSLQEMNERWATPAFATAAQRAEAFLRTIEKWEGE